MMGTYLRSDDEEGTTMRTRHATIAYVIAAIILVAYVAFLVLGKYGVVPGTALSDVTQFVILLAMAVFAAIGLFVDEATR